MDFWVGSWKRESFISLNISYFLLSLTLPMIFYAVVAVSFPNIRMDEKIDLREFYQSHKKIIYGLMACGLLFNGVIANVMEEDSLLNQDNIFRLTAIVLALLVAFSHKQIMERIVLVVGWIVLLIHLTLEDALK
jgi:FtsH-binding integral membrane protein